MSKNVSITLYKSELIYEVQNKTFLTGKSRDDGSNFEQVANMQAGDEEEHTNQILRSIGNASDSLKVKLANYISGTGVAANDIQIDTTEKSIVLDLVLPDNYNLAMNDTVKGALHKFIVNMCLFDWFTITKPDEAEVYNKLSQTNIEEIREAINKRVKPKRNAPVTP